MFCFEINLAQMSNSLLQGKNDILTFYFLSILSYCISYTPFWSECQKILSTTSKSKLLQDTQGKFGIFLAELVIHQLVFYILDSIEVLHIECIRDWFLPLLQKCSYQFLVLCLLLVLKHFNVLKGKCVHFAHASFCSEILVLCDKITWMWLSLTLI